MSFGDNCCAAIPEPTTTATSKPVPRNSANNRGPNAGTEETDGCNGVRATQTSCRNRGNTVTIQAMNIERSGALQRRAAKHAALSDPARLMIIDTLSLGDASPSELQAMLAMPSNLLAHHVKVLENEGLIVRTRYEA